MKKIKDGVARGNKYRTLMLHSVIATCLASAAFCKTDFVFSPYKDAAIDLNPTIPVLSTRVNGAGAQSLIEALPSGVSAVTWAFATGTCGHESWAQGVDGTAFASANVAAWVAAGKRYVISTGGEGGKFTCDNDADFMTFINRYHSPSLLGVDFDIEASQTQADIDNLVIRVINAKRQFPDLRFSFTVATFGGTAKPILGAVGLKVMQAIRRYHLHDYDLNLMTMDYGTATASNCTIGPNGQCGMGASAVKAAISLHRQFHIPYKQIEVTPMIGGNDTLDETFTLADVSTLARFSKQHHLGGVHFWSIDRDRDCAPGPASSNCNTYGQAGTWGFSKTFASELAQ